MPVIADTEPPPPMYWTTQSVFVGVLTYLKKEQYSVLTMKKSHDLCFVNKKVER